jgi:hypothetical protein
MEAFEPTSLVPRSIIRTFFRFVLQLEPKSEDLAVQEFRISRDQVIVSVKTMFLLLIVPLIVNFCSKNFLFQPLVQYYWNGTQHDIFLNSYQENRALAEMETFSERLFFESLIRGKDESIILSHEPSEGMASKIFASLKMMVTQGFDLDRIIIGENRALQPTLSSSETGQLLTENSQQKMPNYLIEEELVNLDFQREVLQVIEFYNKESIQAICNILGELLTLLSIVVILIVMRVEMIILKSFLTESFYSLSDTTKSFIIILVTDLFVGFHSPRGWEISLETVLKHYGLAGNQDFIFLFVATFPVFLDTFFKYWVFRYLNKISPSTVVTYHNMIE